MAEKVITIGGKGTSLSSTSVYSIAALHSQVRVDSSAVERLSSSSSTNQNPPSVTKPQLPFLSTSQPLEARASLAVLLNILLNSSRKVRAFLPSLVSDALNSKTRTLGLGLESVELTEEELVVVDKSEADVYGVAAILDYEATALATVVDVVAALSCEAVGGDVSGFNLADSGDGSVDKEEIAVASDLKVLLNGSKYVGKAAVEVFSKVPKINGRLREVAKLVHSRIRVELNSSGGDGEAVGIKVSPLAAVLRDMGESSFCRAKMSLDAVGNEGVRNGLRSLFENECPAIDALCVAFKSAMSSLIEKDYGKFVQELHVLMGLVWSIVTWEGIMAFVALEGGDLMDGNRVEDGEVNVRDVKVDKKSEKKKKKAVLGKGTGVIVQLIKDRLHCKLVNSSDGVEILRKWAEDLMLFFDPKEPDFDGLVKKVKEIVESNESRRLPKLPKVMKSK